MSEELRETLHNLMKLPTETEWVEFKEAKNNYDYDDLGRYFSALSNEANIKKQTSGWLIFGITDSLPRKIVGTKFRNTSPGLENLKKEFRKDTNHQLTFINIHQLIFPEGRVIMFEIPPAPQGIPTTWKGRPYGRTHDSNEPLSLAEIDLIRNQKPRDWSAELVDSATINDLDPDAIAFARQEYKKKHSKIVSEIDRWDDVEFLNRSKLCVNGKLTKATILLLGKGESVHYLSPATAWITWVLKDDSGLQKDYEHFGLPFILAVNEIFDKIRNLNYRHISDETLFPLELTQYDPWVIRECLHNCIAHQDYSEGAKISIVEYSDSLLFSNSGFFIPESIESLLKQDSPPEKYRNPLLARAMENLNMIDSIGSGIRRMFEFQRERNFPLPDYDLNKPNMVNVRIFGKVIDSKYTRMLIRRKDLSLLDVVALDKVQKGYPLSDMEFKALKSKKLIEGRRRNLYVSEKVAAETDTREDYIRKRSFDKRHFKDMIIEYLKTFGEADRRAIEKLILDKVSDALTEDQKRLFIKNLLQDMRKDGTVKIKEEGSKTFGAKWVLSQSQNKN